MKQSMEIDISGYFVIITDRKQVNNVLRFAGEPYHTAVQNILTYSHWTCLLLRVTLFKKQELLSNPWTNHSFFENNGFINELMAFNFYRNVSDSRGL